MSRNARPWLSVFLTLIGASLAFAASPEIGGKGQAALDASAQSGKYCFLLFYKTNDAATQTAAKTVSEGVTKRSDRATYGFVNVADLKEQAVVARYNASRAPMPLMLAIAPNGAVTNAYPKAFEDGDLDAAFVTPGMAQVMKQMQGGKMVFLCVHPAGSATTPPAAVSQFMADPQYRDRAVTLPLLRSDPAEARFVSDLKLDPKSAFDTTVVFLAPPGVMVGKYSSIVTKAQLASDLHAAGKCCDDPNCKHNHK